MSRDKVLPPRLTIRDIQEYLEMDCITGNPHQQLSDHIEANDFTLYLMHKELDIYGEDDVVLNNEIPILVKGAKPLEITESVKVKNITYKPASIFDSHYDKKTKDKPFRVERVIFQGAVFYVTPRGEKSIGVTLDENDFYSLRDEIIAYRKRDIYKDTLDNNKLGSQNTGVEAAELQPYLDHNSEFYAEELDLAIQLHKAIHIEKFGNQARNRIDRVSQWLIVNRPNLKTSEAKINRLSAIITINIDKNKKST